MHPGFLVMLGLFIVACFLH